MQDDQLLTIAREVATTVRNNATIDWRRREQVRAKLKTTVKRVLRKHGYPPDQAEGATQLILEQAEALRRRGHLVGGDSMSPGYTHRQPRPQLANPGPCPPPRWPDWRMDDLTGIFPHRRMRIVQVYGLPLGVRTGNIAQGGEISALRCVR